MNTLHLAGEAMLRVHEGQSQTAAALAAVVRRLARDLLDLLSRPFPNARTQ